MSKFRSIINQFTKKKILVIGDIILDRYIIGSVSRISPEAPVPVLLENQIDFKLGGAANVTHNLCALGAEVIQVGRIGNDFEGKILKRLMKKAGIETHGIFVDKNFPTITKTRVIAQHQQIVRIDKEKSDAKGDAQVNKKLRSFLAKQIPECDAVIISDYGKGLITPEILKEVCDVALNAKKIITVDPKVGHFNFYRRVTAITPNLKEAENAIRNIKITCDSKKILDINTERLNTDAEINFAGEKLLEFLELQSLLITLGERGMRLFEKGKKPVSIKTKAQEVFDVTGAGDAVISVFTLGLTAKATKKQAAELSNFAAGIVVGKMGAAAVSKEELLKVTK